MRATAPLLLSFLAPLLACAPAPAPVPPPAPALASALASAPAPASGSASASASAPASPPRPAPLTDADRLDDAKSSNDFTTRLYTRLRRAPGNGNVMISGTSARQALGIVALGAAPASGTEREMTTALALPTDRARRSALAIAETAAWQEARGSAELALANRIWIEQSVATKPDFVAAANAAFGTGTASVDFLHAPDVARRTINAWAAEATSHKIENLFAEGMITSSTRLVVANAVYFKAKWAATFPANATKNEPFASFATPGASTAGARADVPMMHGTAGHRFAHAGGVRVLEMRYAASELAMLLVLPDDAAPAALAKVEDALSGDAFEAWRTALRPHRVTVTLPRFKFESGGPLDPALQELGMRAAFAPSADFSGIADPANGERLQIARVVQRTYVSVDENGTEAAAATGVAMTALSASLAPVADFKADHPFLFFVYDVTAGRILFAGRVTAPRS